MINKERVAVVTGATGGLGKAVVRHFADMGLRLGLFGTSETNLARLTGEMGLSPELTLIKGLDFRQPEAADQAARMTLERFGRADILVQLIGGWAGGMPLAEAPAATLEQMLQQHVWTTFHLARAFLPLFQRGRWGRVVAISSGSVGLPNPGSGLYAAAKAAQESLILSIAQEYRGDGITGNILRVQTIDEEHERLQDPSPKNANWTTPEEIASAVMFLCSEEASMLNGARIPLYGRP